MTLKCKAAALLPFKGSGLARSKSFNSDSFGSSNITVGDGNGNPLQYSCLENPREEEPGGLPSMGSHRVGHD